MDKKYLTRTDVMERFEIRSTATLYDWIRKGRLPRPIRFGRRVKFRRESIEKAENRLVERAEENMR